MKFRLNAINPANGRTSYVSAHVAWVLYPEPNPHNGRRAQYMYRLSQPVIYPESMNDPKPAQWDSGVRYNYSVLTPLDMYHVEPNNPLWITFRLKPSEIKW